MIESVSEESGFFPRFQTVAGFLLCIFLLAPFSLSASAQSVHEPARGSGERQELLDAVRPLLEVRVGKPVEFVVDWMRSGNGWAFVQVSPQRPGGAAIDLANTTLAAQADYMDGLISFVLLRYDYGRWNLVDFVVGPTDAFWHGDPLYVQLPQGLTPY
ncbi:hypothetical protein [Roseibium sp. M-1]